MAVGAELGEPAVAGAQIATPDGPLGVAHDQDVSAAVGCHRVDEIGLIGAEAACPQAGPVGRRVFGDPGIVVARLPIDGVVGRRGDEDVADPIGGDRDLPFAVVPRRSQPFAPQLPAVGGEAGDPGIPVVGAAAAGATEDASGNGQMAFGVGGERRHLVGAGGSERDRPVGVELGDGAGG